MSSSHFLQLLFTGITEGSTYALIALGFTLMYKSTHVINLAHGEFAVIGSMLMASLNAAGVPLAAAFPAATLATAGAGLAFAYLGVRPFLVRRISFLNIVVATVGISMALKTAAMLLWGRDPVPVPPFLPMPPVRLGGAFLHPQSLWVVGVALGIVLLMGYFLERTLLGRALRACAEDPDAARLMGISDQRMVLYSILCSAALGAVAGMLIAPIAYARFDFGIYYTIKGFTAGILGGLDRPLGAVAGGLLIGLLEAFTAGAIASGLKDLVTLAVLLAVLWVSPTGLFRTRVAGRH